MRALKFIQRLPGSGIDARAWLLRSSGTRFTIRIARAGNGTGLRNIPTPCARDLKSPAPGPDDVLLRSIDIEALRAAVEELPDEFREVLILREMEGMQYEQIS